MGFKKIFANISKRFQPNVSEVKWLVNRIRRAQKLAWIYAKSHTFIEKIFTQWNKHYANFKLEFRETDMSPGQTEVKQGKFVEF